MLGVALLLVLLTGAGVKGYPCPVDDRFEPNDNAANARQVELGTSYENLTVCGGPPYMDRDFYSVKPNCSKTVVILFYPLIGGALELDSPFTGAWKYMNTRTAITPQRLTIEPGSLQFFVVNVTQPILFSVTASGVNNRVPEVVVYRMDVTCGDPSGTQDETLTNVVVPIPINIIDYGGSVTSETLPQPPIVSFGGHFYQLVLARTQFDDAAQTALNRTHQGLQGHLLTITSQAENDFVAAYMRQHMMDLGIWIAAVITASQHVMVV